MVDAGGIASSGDGKDRQVVYLFEAERWGWRMWDCTLDCRERERVRARMMREEERRNVRDSLLLWERGWNGGGYGPCLMEPLRRTRKTAIAGLEYKGWILGNAVGDALGKSRINIRN